MSFIYKHETSTLTPIVKLHDILNLAIQNIFYAQPYVESAFMYNPGSTHVLTQLHVTICCDSDINCEHELEI